MEFFDSNVIVKVFYENEYTEKCQDAIREGGITNTLCLVEAFHILEGITNQEKSQRAIKTMLKSNLEVIEVGNKILFEAIKKIQKYNLKIFDMIHYTTAILNNCTAIISYDKDFNNLEIQRKEP